MATPLPNPFTTGYSFTPSEIVTSIKLSEIVNNVEINYPQLAQNILGSGSTNPNALVRFTADQIQLRNATTGMWHSIWIQGTQGEEEIAVGVGTT
jgi:hypothetical protein